MFDAFLDPELIRSWFGPGLGEILHIDVHMHVGGMFSISQRRGDGTVLDTHGTFRTLDRPHQIVFSWVTPAAQLPEGLVTVEIELREGGVALTLTHEPDSTWAGPIAEIEAGWTHMLEAMSEALGCSGTGDPSGDPSIDQPADPAADSPQASTR